MLWHLLKVFPGLTSYLWISSGRRFISQTPHALSCLGGGKESALENTCKIAIINSIKRALIVQRALRIHGNSGCWCSLSDTLMGRKTRRNMTLETGCCFYTPWVSVTSECPLAPAGILSKEPEGSQRGRVGKSSCRFGIKAWKISEEIGRSGLLGQRS